jgi:hypothetical protein
VEFMDLLEPATVELLQMVEDLFPNAPGWGQRANYLEDLKLSSMLSDTARASSSSRASDASARSLSF